MVFVRAAKRPVVVRCLLPAATRVAENSRYRAMFSRSARLPRDQFEALLKDGQRKSSTHLLVRAKKRSDNLPTRVAVSVAKKTLKQAAKRNLLKRQLRHALRAHYATIPIGFDILITARGSFETYSFNEVSSEIGHLLEQLR